MQSYSSGDTESCPASLLAQLTSEQARLEALASAQSEAEQALLVLRSDVQRYVAGRIKGAGNGSGVFMLNVDTQLGMVMLALSQIGKKRILALEQVSEVIQNKMLRKSERVKSVPTPALDKSTKTSNDQAKSDDEYIRIIDKLTKEMFENKDAGAPRKPHSSFSSVPKNCPSSRMTLCSESEYERVIRELDTKLEIQQREERAERGSPGSPGSPGSRPSSVTPRTRERQRMAGPSLEMIDSVIRTPDKISIPERYQTHLDMESGDEDQTDQKALDLR